MSATVTETGTTAARYQVSSDLLQHSWERLDGLHMTARSQAHVMRPIRSCRLNTILDLMRKWILLNHFKYRNVFWICAQAVSVFPWSLIPKRSQCTLSDQIKTAPQNPTPMNSVLFSKAACKLLLWRLVWRLFFFFLNDTAFHEKEVFSYFSA